MLTQNDIRILSKIFSDYGLCHDNGTASRFWKASDKNLFNVEELPWFTTYLIKMGG